MSADEKDKGMKTASANSDAKSKDPCLRCGEPVEIDGELLCKKCEREVH